MLSRRTLSPVSRAAEMAGRTAFFEPLTRTRPRRDRSGSPKMRIFSIDRILDDQGGKFKFTGL